MLEGNPQEPADPASGVSITYPLTAVVEHMRRPLASTLLFAMAKRALRLEKRGGSVEFFQGYLSGDGDFWSVYGVDRGPTPEQPSSAGHAGVDRGSPPVAEEAVPSSA